MNLQISHYAKIENHQIHVNGKMVFSAEHDNSLKAFLKMSYTTLGINYPKFHKMDSLCKLGVLGAHVLKEKYGFSNDMALVFSNAASSLETDRRHQKTLDSYVSPATFVYTLPNIVLGEISIKYNLQSENSFFISENFNAGLLHQYTTALFATASTEEALVGWIDVDADSYNAFLCVISHSGNIPFTAHNLKEIYNTAHE